MILTFKIPIRNHLAKVFLQNKKECNNFDLLVLQDAFLFYAGYEINKAAIKELYFKKKLYKKLKINHYPPKLLIKYPAEKYTYYSVEFRTSNFFLSNNINNNLNFWIKYVNKSLEQSFWLKSVTQVYLNKNKKLDQSVEEFYKENAITDTDYKRNSFKRMLYKKRHLVKLQNFTPKRNNK